MRDDDRTDGKNLEIDLSRRLGAAFIWHHPDTRVIYNTYVSIKYGLGAISLMHVDVRVTPPVDL